MMTIVSFSDCFRASFAGKNLNPGSSLCIEVPPPVPPPSPCPGCGPRCLPRRPMIPHAAVAASLFG